MNLNVSALLLVIFTKQVNNVNMPTSATLPFWCECGMKMVMVEGFRVAGGQGACSLAPERTIVLGGICTLVALGLGKNGFERSSVLFLQPK